MTRTAIHPKTQATIPVIEFTCYRDGITAHKTDVVPGLWPDAPLTTRESRRVRQMLSAFGFCIVPVTLVPSINGTCAVKLYAEINLPQVTDKLFISARARLSYTDDEIALLRLCKLADALQAEYPRIKRASLVAAFVRPNGTFATYRYDSEQASQNSGTTRRGSRWKRNGWGKGTSFSKPRTAR